MIDPDDWTQRFDALARLPLRIRERLRTDSRVLTLPEGARAFGPGHMPESFLMLLSGTVRVCHMSEGGREIVLYRVEAGQSCVLTTACLLAHEAYSAEGIAETEVVAVAIPRLTFDGLLSESPAFRDVVFAAYAQRITDLFHVIDEVAFGRIDMRLAERLLVLSRGASQLHTTHQQLAGELGTAREVVSRQLMDFQRRGWIDQSRGHILLLDRAALERLGSA